MSPLAFTAAQILVYRAVVAANPRSRRVSREQGERAAERAHGRYVAQVPKGR